MELGGDYVQRRCWLKRPILKKSDADCSSSSSSSSAANAPSTSSANNSDQSEARDGLKSCETPAASDVKDNAKKEEEEKKLENHEKRKYQSPKSKKWFPSQYVLEYLDQDQEEVHAKLRKDWFCMDKECNRWEND